MSYLTDPFLVYYVPKTFLWRIANLTPWPGCTPAPTLVPSPFWVRSLSGHIKPQKPLDLNSETCTLSKREGTNMGAGSPTAPPLVPFTFLSEAATDTAQTTCTSVFFSLFKFGWVAYMLTPLWANLMSLETFCSRIWKWKKGSPWFGKRVDIKWFLHYQFNILFMVKTNKDLCTSKAMVENNFGTHTTLSPTKCIHQHYNFVISWLVAFVHCHFTDSTTSTYKCFVTKLDAPIWSTYVAQTCYPTNSKVKWSIFIFKFVIHQKLMLSWTKLIRAWKFSNPSPWK